MRITITTTTITTPTENSRHRVKEEAAANIAAASLSFARFRSGSAMPQWGNSTGYEGDCAWLIAAYPLVTLPFVPL